MSHEQPQSSIFKINCLKIIVINDLILFFCSFHTVMLQVVNWCFTMIVMRWLKELIIPEVVSESVFDLWLCCTDIYWPVLLLTWTQVCSVLPALCQDESAVDGGRHLPLRRGLLRASALHPLHLTQEVRSHLSCYTTHLSCCTTHLPCYTTHLSCHSTHLSSAV